MTKCVYLGLMDPLLTGSGQEIRFTKVWTRALTSLGQPVGVFYKCCCSTKPRLGVKTLPSTNPYGIALYTAPKALTSQKSQMAMARQQDLDLLAWTEEIHRWVPDETG